MVWDAFPLPHSLLILLLFTLSFSEFSDPDLNWLNPSLLIEFTQRHLDLFLDDTQRHTKGEAVQGSRLFSVN